VAAVAQKCRQHRHGLCTQPEAVKQSQTCVGSQLKLV